MHMINVFLSSIIILLPITAHARCAVCYTSGMSGASIAVIIIIFSFLFLFFANKFLRIIIDKKKS